MKFTAVCLAVLLTCTSAYVTNNNKVIETTTKLPVDDDYELVDKSSVDSKTETPKNIYLEDVVAGLVHQNWSSDEILCLNQTLELIRSLQNFTLWAVWEWDSVSSQPMGIMSGNRYQLGNFDQCMRAPWSATHPEIKTQYCLAEVKLEREHHAKKKRLEENEPYGNALDFIQHHTPYVRPLNHLTWGACVPASCQPRSVERLVSTVLARSHLGVAGLRPSIEAKEPCQMADRPRQYDALFYAFIALALVMSITCLICTYINIKNKEPRKQSLKYNICKAFCIRDNCRDLLKVNKDGLDTIYGIRYISICFISICHEAGLLDSGPLSNGIKVDRNFITSAAVFVVHDDVFVDTFFFISGFLLAKTIVTFKKVPVLLYLIKRYLRLAVAFAVVIFYMVAIFPHTGSGPLWNRLVKDEVGTCRKNWWLSLLMVNNYIRSDELCLFVTWYIPCDFHFFVLAVVTYAIYRRWRSLGIMCAGALAVASVVTPGVINYVYEQAAIHMFTYDFLSDPRNNQQFQLTYIKSHTRAAPYIIGFAAGAYYAKKKNDIKLTKTRATVSAWLGVVVMLLVMVSGSSYLWRSYSNLESALYAALNRPVWAAGVALLILSCSFGKVPLLQGFLSWYPWVPLSRLAYGQYLTHTLIILRNVGIVRNSVYYDDFNVFVSAMGVIAVGTGTALIVFLLAEAPINNLFTLLVTSKNRSQQNQDDQTKSNTTTQIGDRVNMGYIQDNLTDNLNSSSKM